MDAITAQLAGHEVEVQNYQPGLDFHDQGKDLVILSGGGGEGLEIVDKVGPTKLLYEDEMEFVRSTNVPIFGICMGFEVIVKAYGGKVHYRPKLTYGQMNSYTTEKGQKAVGHKVINQVEAHYWYVPEVPRDKLEVLARSDSGIEMVSLTDKMTQKTGKKVLASQFHPEEGGTISLKQMLAHL